VKKVYLVGRRGPLQCAYTIAELREMLKLPNVNTIWRKSDFDGIAEKVDSLARPRKRLTELMLKSCGEVKNASNEKSFCPIFFRSPSTINSNNSTGAVESIDFNVTKVENDRATATNDNELINAQLVCKSIGYKSICVDESINFDEKRGRVINNNGRVLKPNSNETDVGLYAAGWLATGPSGVILTTMNNAFNVAQTIIDDVKNGTLKCDETKRGIDVNNFNAVTWKNWMAIDRKEIEKGNKSNKPREKIVSIEEMMKLI
jgi:adrenodoxin-NADP+ reductase